MVYKLVDGVYSSQHSPLFFTYSSLDGARLNGGSRAFLILNISTHALFHHACTIIDSMKQPHRLCLVVYYLPDGFEPKVEPHGNSKSKKPFYPTLPSTMAAMASEVGEPKKVMAEVSSAIGGVLSASDACLLHGMSNKSQI